MVEIGSPYSSTSVLLQYGQVMVYCRCPATSWGRPRSHAMHVRSVIAFTVSHATHRQCSPFACPGSSSVRALASACSASYGPATRCAHPPHTHHPSSWAW
ncbi:hypothetical protein F7Q99_38900 [Streptomyces kaniharaensis]|uniref:Uncharacterized protein n=1 Tax=Streptomyces kaniharaensis TaxID=212423 RepID=A0A6N7L2B8_9ACTN|nr:hypothetical protein [Streptomyces kaniharaensis]MQS18002.1 hypothetical protein [Streptomyces kaniharaensis]